MLSLLLQAGARHGVLEMLMIWQLLQVHHLSDAPLLLVGSMWPGLIEWAKTSMLSAESPLANADDMNIPQCVANAETVPSRSSASIMLCGCERTVPSLPRSRLAKSKPKSP